MIPWSLVEGALRAAAQRPASTLHVNGRPGGLLRLREGRVVGAWTTGTPLAIPRPEARTPSPEGATPGLLSRAAMADAIFVMAAGRIDGVREEPGPTARVTGEIAVEQVLTEVRRRLPALVRADGRTLRPEDDRVRPTGTGSALRLLSTTERTVLALADGNHSVRDLAFLTDRGVYAVLLDALHLVRVGAVEFVPDLFEAGRDERRAPAGPERPGEYSLPPHTAQRVSALLAARREPDSRREAPSTGADGASATVAVPVVPAGPPVPGSAPPEPVGSDLPARLARRITEAGRVPWLGRRARD